MMIIFKWQVYFQSNMYLHAELPRMRFPICTLFYEVVSKEQQNYDQHIADEAASFGFIFKSVVSGKLQNVS